MRAASVLVVVCLSLLLLAGPARGEQDVLVRNRTTVAAALADGADVHTYGVACPAGARFTARAKTAKGGPSLALRAVDPYGTEVGAATGRRPAVVVARNRSDAGLAVEVTSADGAAGGSYELSINWKSPSLFKGRIDVAPAGQGEFPFSVDAGATVTLSVKASRGGSAPSLVAVVAPDGTVLPLAGGASARLVLGSGGTHVLRFGGGPGGGAVRTVVRANPPRTARSTLRIPVGGLAPEARTVAFAEIGALGGVLDADGTPLAGASVSVPGGALTLPATFSIGLAPPLSISRAGTPGGPAVFFGPEGLTFPSGSEATVTIPYDAAAFPSGTAGLRVFTRGADGQVTEIADPVVDTVAGTVSFPAAHFSAFQVLLDFDVAEKQRLTDTQPIVFGQFGWGVAVDGDVAAVGSTNGQSAVEAVQTFRRDAGVWSPDARFGVANPAFGQGLGTTLSLSGNRLLVGAQGRAGSVTGSQGTAFVFLRTGPGAWSQEAELPVPFDSQTQRTGFSVSIDGDTAVVSAPVAAAGAVGKVHVFVRDTGSGVWGLQQTLAPVLPVNEASFGFAVAVRGDRILVGSNTDGPGGAVYLFRRSGTVWTQAALLRPSDLEAGDRFGSSVALDGTTLVIGCDDQPAGVTGRKPVRVFEDQGSAFPLVARLDPSGVVASGESPLDAFGRSVAIRGGVLVVGAPFHGTVFTPGGAPVPLSGNAYVYRRAGGTWRLSSRLRGTSTDAFPIGPSDNLGQAVAFDGSTILAGAVNDDTAANFAGAVFVFDVTGN